ncbi:MAG: tRNA pseudouridine(38-40) synthase TruA [Verrucomicrobia bacterium]|nr:tRNA pseudouridine(38-40) synthase TruA [Verrucomicrobiota bacterium]
MQRYKLTLAYDGTAYAGWQIQPGVMTVQERLELTIEALCGERPRVHGSGRTDQGVHARGQVAHFDLQTARPVEMLYHGLNGLLPADIRVAHVGRAPANFHARRSAVSKTYRYLIWNGEICPPDLRLFRTHCKAPLDLAAMNAAAARLVGRRDFAAFTANPNRVVDSTIRDVTRLRVTRRGAEVALLAEGEGFLYKMVRSLAGLLIRVGEGAVDPSAATDILNRRVRTARVPTAPPQGLFLWKVKY